jgi:signal transduction histidine kinase
MSAYCASKAGVEAFADCLRQEVRHLGVDVGVAYFSWIATDLVAAGDEHPAFVYFRSQLRGPAGRTYPLSHAVNAVERGIRRRAKRVVAPGWVRALLATRGVADALRSECAHSAIPVEIVAADVGRSAPGIETAVYLCCLESIQNAAKHAGSSASVKVVLQRRGHELAFAVRDSGRGFDPSVTAPGAGLTSVRDRVETIGGHFEITTAPGRGTTVAGVVPWPPRAAF